MIQVVLLGRMASGIAPELARRIRHPHLLTAVPDVSKIDEFRAALAEAEVLVGWPLTDALIAGAPKLRLAQASGAGIDGLDPDRLPPGVQLANTFHHEAAIAEYVLMAMLWLTRRPHEYDARLRSGNWQDSCIWGATPVLPELRGQTAMILGLGHIAREVAIRARAFGVRLIGVSRRVEPDPHYDEVIGWSEWKDRLAETGFLIPCCPLTPETHGLIGAEIYERLPSTACVINMTRGRVLDEQATYDALRTGRIAGAALDVWYQYPSDPAESRLPSLLPFHELPNVLLSPHNSAWTVPTITGRVEDIAENVNRLVEGRELLHRLR
jgi:phosphoglycerate dehydrogenase-like enzyme